MIMTNTNNSNNNSNNNINKRPRNRKASRGDIVTLNIDLSPEDGFVPEPLFDTKGTIQFVVGWGNYLPGVHALVEGCQVGDSVHAVSIDAGWGARRDDLIVRVPLQKVQEILAQSPAGPGVPVPGKTTLKLRGGIEVLVTEVSDDGMVVLDANPPLAGTSYSCSFTVLAIDSLPSLNYIPDDNDDNEEKASSGRYQAATFGLGCFWGGELRFMRVEGVVGTKVGYSQGITKNPTYQEVCTGRTKHREAVMVVYDTTQVTYEQLVKVALDRLRSTTKPPWELHRLFQEEGEQESYQYRYGFYYHSEAQRQVAERVLAEEKKDKKRNWDIEVLQARVLYEAEDEMQQYLYKGGQSARKGAKEEIRCYG